MLVSAIMPTRDRREFIPTALACFAAQTYPNKELVIVDNGNPIRDLIPPGLPVTYMHVGEERLTIGEMRNRACSLTSGELIAHWDDDDVSHPARLKEQVKFLTSNQAAIVGYRSMYFLDEARQKAWVYRNDALYALGTSFLYRREYWRAGKFPDQDIFEDGEFIDRAQRVRSLFVTDAGDRMVATIHPGNICERQISAPMWVPADFGYVQGLTSTGKVAQCA